MPRWTKYRFGIKNKRTNVRQEVLAGIVGWQAAVSSFTLCEYKKMATLMLPDPRRMK